MSIEELILDEEEAIRGYEKALENETDPDIIRAFNAIIIDALPCFCKSSNLFIKSLLILISISLINLILPQ